MKKKSAAVLSAVNLNSLQINSREIHAEDRVINKLRHLLKRAKLKKCMGLEEAREVDKMNTVRCKVKYSRLS